jgi:hypothetical protein
METSPIATHEVPITAELSDEDRLLISSELDRMLESEPFRKSVRYPALLRYVVTMALEGKGNMLKERTLGVEVFKRPLEYDTSADPVVRFTAGEVRRRIAHYYQNDREPRSIEIGLPVGSYVPVFVKRSATDDLGRHSDHSVQPSRSAVDPMDPDPINLAGQSRGFVDREIRAQPVRWYKQRIIAWSIPVAVAATLLVAVARYRSQNPVMELWRPLLRQNNGILISVGRPEIDSERQIDDPKMTIKQHFVSPGFRVSMTAVSAIAGISGFLHTQEKPYRIQDASSSSLQDLHGRPVVLVNANDNQWTTLLLQRLRFHILQKGEFSYIEDADHPERKDWGEDFNTPFREQKYDYAVVARYFDQTTDGPVLVVAGVGANGTEAAGDFVVSPIALAAFARSAPIGWQSKNFELVLRVEVVNGGTGKADVIASKFW